jgi:acetyl-CoA carboxylase biotin carboxyl carrier protein
MTERATPDGNLPERHLRILCAEVAALLRDVPPGCRGVSARIGACAVELTWAQAPSGTAEASDTAATGTTGRVPRSSLTPDPVEDTIAVRAPVVGTVYRAPEPGARSFVEVGERVAAGQVVAIVEAMKLMNEVEAPRAGVITELLVDDAEGVEFDQVILRIKPDTG